LKNAIKSQQNSPAGATTGTLTLVDLIREMRHGRIENFRVVDGKPIVGASTEVCVEYKLSGVEQPSEVINEREFLKKPQVRAMFEKLEQVRHGTVDYLDVRDGLPFKLMVRRKALR
jgi:hypothetical protein